MTESTTPLGYAARRGHLEMVRFLLEGGADPGAPAEQAWARPVACAQLEGRADVVELLW